MILWIKRILDSKAERESNLDHEEDDQPKGLLHIRLALENFYITHF